MLLALKGKHYFDEIENVATSSVICGKGKDNNWAITHSTSSFHPSHPSFVAYTQIHGGMHSRKIQSDSTTGKQVQQQLAQRQLTAYKRRTFNFHFILSAIFMHQCSFIYDVKCVRASSMLVVPLSAFINFVLSRFWWSFHRLPQRFPSISFYFSLNYFSSAGCTIHWTCSLFRQLCCSILHAQPKI